MPKWPHFEESACANLCHGSKANDLPACSVTTNPALSLETDDNQHVASTVTEDTTNRPSFQKLPVPQMSMKSTVYQCRIVMITYVEECLDHVPEALWVQFFHLDAVQGHQQISALDLVPGKIGTNETCISYHEKLLACCTRFHELNNINNSKTLTPDYRN